MNPFRQKSMESVVVEPLTALLQQVLTNQRQILANQETIMGTQAQDDANLAAGIDQIKADEAQIKQAITDATSRVLDKLSQAPAAATDPAVQAAVADLTTLHAAMTGDLAALASIAPASAPAAATGPTGETVVG